MTTRHFASGMFFTLAGPVERLGHYLAEIESASHTILGYFYRDLPDSQRRLVRDAAPEMHHAHCHRL
jgi:hypothetical protein